MASQVGGSPLNLKLDLLMKGHEYSFFQVMRLLRLLLQSTGEKREDLNPKGDEKIRVKPALSLAFPASDVAKVEELGDESPSFLVTATFLGLYGSSSPLPNFYTEDLIDEASEDMSVSRDFMDGLNHRLYILLFYCWLKYRQFLQVVEEKNPRDLEKLFCFLGLGEPELRRNLPDPYPLIRYIGLFSQFPRSASGLETLLKDALEGVPINVIPCVKRTVSIPPDQRFYLGSSGNSLGESSFLGEELDDRMGKFSLQIGPLKSDPFHALLPEDPRHKRLAFLTKFYVTDPLEYDLQLILAKQEAKKACLGGRMWSRLGWNTWIFSVDHLDEVSVTLPPKVA